MSNNNLDLELHNANLCVNLMEQAFQQVRQYLPDDDKLTNADKMALAMFERARKCANDQYNHKP